MNNVLLTRPKRLGNNWRACKLVQTPLERKKEKKLKSTWPYKMLLFGNDFALDKSQKRSVYWLVEYCSKFEFRSPILHIFSFLSMFVEILGSFSFVLYVLLWYSYEGVYMYKIRCTCQFKFYTFCKAWFVMRRLHTCYLLVYVRKCPYTYVHTSDMCQYINIYINALIYTHTKKH